MIYYTISHKIARYNPNEFKINTIFSNLFYDNEIGKIFHIFNVGIVCLLVDYDDINDQNIINQEEISNFTIKQHMMRIKIGDQYMSGLKNVNYYDNETKNIEGIIFSNAFIIKNPTIKLFNFLLSDNCKAYISEYANMMDFITNDNEMMILTSDDFIDNPINPHFINKTFEITSTLYIVPNNDDIKQNLISNSDEKIINYYFKKYNDVRTLYNQSYDKYTKLYDHSLNIYKDKINFHNAIKFNSNQIEEIANEIELLKESIQNLEQQSNSIENHINYCPDSIGYFEAKKSFNDLSSKNQ